MKKVTAAISLALALSFGMGVLGACGGDNTDKPVTPHTPVTIDASSVRIVVHGYEGGPTVDGVVLGLGGNVSGVSKDTFTVTTGNDKRTVADAYVSNEKGERVTGDSSYVTVTMNYEASAYNWGGYKGANVLGNPFTYSGMNTWSQSMKIAVKVADGKSFTAGNKTYEGGDSLTYTADIAKDRIVPQTASWTKDSVHYTDEGKDITLQRASWTPEGAATDSGKDPLVIWLHGAGEGGTDIDIDLLGNEVTALTDTAIQSYFKQDGLAGAYVLAVQTPTMWMDQDGQGTYNHTDVGDGSPQESWYTEALWQAITTYVESNPDVDTNRIYLGGCSNGGYMTMNMMFHYGEYFAAYYPTCEAYVNGRISDEMIGQIKDYKIWFILSNDDGTVAPDNFEKPTFDRLLKAGASDVHMTLFESVVGTDAPGVTYDGHWSWIYVFNDGVKKEFDNEKVTGVEYLTPANCTKDASLWQWMAAQKKDGETPTPPPAIEGTEYTFEAEKGVITNGKTQQYDWQTSEVEQPVTVETGTEWGGDKDTAGPEVTALGYFNGGATVTFTITSDKECDALLTLRAASTENETDLWTGGSTFTVKEADLSKGEHATLAVNGTNVALAGILPGLSLTGIGWGDMGWIYSAPLKNFGTGTAVIHLNEGENTIVLTAAKGFNLDKIVIKADATLTWTETDNSSRVPQA